MSISVLMSVYKYEKAVCLDRALRSVWDDQILKPDEIILIEDGPLGQELLDVIGKWKVSLSEHLIVLRNENNIGLTRSLNKGIQYAKGDYIARMDSDDISYPERFDMQFRYMMKNQNVSVLGGGIQEIDENDNWGHLRLYPVKMSMIVKYITKANPLAHSTTFIRRKIFDDGFLYDERFRKNQDLDLWFRLLNAGYEISNLPFPVLYFRRTSDTYSKRSSYISLKSELKIYAYGIHLLYGNFTWRYIYPVTRLIIKLLPPVFIGFVYKNLFKKKNI